MKNFLLISCLITTQQVQSSRGSAIYPLQKYKTDLKNEKYPKPEFIHYPDDNTGLSLKDYLTLYKVAHGKKSAKKMTALLEPLSQENKKTIYQRVAAENKSAVEKIRTPELFPCLYTSQQKRALSLQEALEARSSALAVEVSEDEL